MGGNKVPSSVFVVLVVCIPQPDMSPDLGKNALRCDESRLVLEGRRVWVCEVDGIGVSSPVQLGGVVHIPVPEIRQPCRMTLEVVTHHLQHTWAIYQRKKQNTVQQIIINYFFKCGVNLIYFPGGSLPTCMPACLHVCLPTLTCSLSSILTVPIVSS